MASAARPLARAVCFHQGAGHGIATGDLVTVYLVSRNMSVISRCFVHIK